MRSRAEIKAHSWNVVKQFYWPTVGSFCLLMILSFACSIVPIFLQIFVFTIINVGSLGYFLCRYRRRQANVGILFLPFHRYGFIENQY